MIATSHTLWELHDINNENTIYNPDNCYAFMSRCYFSSHSEKGGLERKLVTQD